MRSLAKIHNEGALLEGLEVIRLVCGKEILALIPGGGVDRYFLPCIAFKAPMRRDDVRSLRGTDALFVGILVKVDLPVAWSVSASSFNHVIPESS